MILTWCDFFLLVLWIVFFSFLLLINNLINLLLLSELVWILLFLNIIVVSTFYDSFFLFLVGLFVLGLAACETAVGLSLLILKSSIFGTVTNFDNLNYNNYFLYKNKNVSLIFSKISNGD